MTAVAAAGPAEHLGHGLYALVRGLVRSALLRIAFAVGLVLGVAILGALAFTAPDFKIVWPDENGRLVIVLKRAERSEEIEQAHVELNRANRALAASTEELRRRDEALKAAEKASADARGEVKRAHSKLAEHSQAIAGLRREKEEALAASRADVNKLEARVAEKDREIARLSNRTPVTGSYEYRAARLSDQAYLPLRERPERGTPILATIPAHASGIRSGCRIAVYEDAVFVEASYRGRIGWLSGFYLSPARE